MQKLQFPLPCKLRWDNFDSNKNDNEWQKKIYFAMNLTQYATTLIAIYTLFLLVFDNKECYRDQYIEYRICDIYIYTSLCRDKKFVDYELVIINTKCLDFIYKHLMFQVF